MTDRKDGVARRRVVAGLATTGAAVGAVVAVAPGQPAPPAAGKAAAVTAAADGDGYRLTDHIKRYYASARI